MNSAGYLIDMLRDATVRGTPEITFCVGRFTGHSSAVVGQLREMGFTVTPLADGSFRLTFGNVGA